VLLRIPLPLTIIQILAVDLGTDMLPALALGAERPDPDVMRQPPRQSQERLLSWPLVARAYLWLGPLQALVALTAKALGKVNDAHITAAVIIEMVHLATLVHDDVMDEAEIRRDQLTLAANWGNEIAVLFGDCLFAQALKLAASFPTPEVCRAVAMATNTVCSGEILQTQQCRKFQDSQREYFRVIEMKTAELFKLSCDLYLDLLDQGGGRRE